MSDNVLPVLNELSSCKNSSFKFVIVLPVLNAVGINKITMSCQCWQQQNTMFVSVFRHHYMLLTTVEYNVCQCLASIKSSAQWQNAMFASALPVLNIVGNGQIPCLSVSLQHKM